MVSAQQDFAKFIDAHNGHQCVWPKGFQIVQLWSSVITDTAVAVLSSVRIPVQQQKLAKLISAPYGRRKIANGPNVENYSAIELCRH